MSKTKIKFLGLITLLTLSLLFLKAFKVINIGWLWVFAPIWISAIIVVGIILVVLVITIIAAIID